MLSWRCCHHCKESSSFHFDLSPYLVNTPISHWPLSVLSVSRQDSATDRAETSQNDAIKDTREVFLTSHCQNKITLWTGFTMLPLPPGRYGRMCPAKIERGKIGGVRRGRCRELSGCSRTQYYLPDIGLSITSTWIWNGWSPWLFSINPRSNHRQTLFRHQRYRI